MKCIWRVAVGKQGDLIWSTNCGKKTEVFKMTTKKCNFCKEEVELIR